MGNLSNSQVDALLIVSLVAVAIDALLGFLYGRFTGKRMPFWSYVLAILILGGIFGVLAMWIANRFGQASWLQKFAPSDMGPQARPPATMAGVSPPLPWSETSAATFPAPVIWSAPPPPLAPPADPDNPGWRRLPGDARRQAYWDGSRWTGLATWDGTAWRPDPGPPPPTAH